MPRPTLPTHSLAQRSIAALTIALVSGGEIQILPAGVFRSRDGRPDDVAGWYCDEQTAAALIAKAAARQTPYVVDYEHQTLMADTNGQPAPAAGWFKTLVWREGQGLFATDVEWTARAKAMIDAAEYRFLSPVFRYDSESGAVLELLNVALTNTPGLDGMRAVAALSSRFFQHDSDEEITMNPFLQKLLAALDLTDKATEQEALQAVATLKAESDTAASLAGEVAALKAGHPDPAKYAPVAVLKELQTQVAALSAQIAGREVEAVVSEALAANKLTPALAGWARELGGKDLAALKAFVKASPVLAPVSGQSGGKAGGAGGGVLSETELAVCRQMGISPEDFAKTRGVAA